MGCLFTKRSPDSRRKQQGKEIKKEYSWDKKEKVNPKDYTIENLKNETIARLPGTINGQQFIIQNCENCNIYLFDHSNTVSVDDCTNCHIYIGPCKGSVFLRDCQDCKCVIACQQFRTRDCKKMTIFLSCATQPIIESSVGMHFGCFQFYYPELDEQFKAAELLLFTNNWSNIYDFTPVEGETNWSILTEDSKIEDYLHLPSQDQYPNLKISLKASDSIVPLTSGSQRKPSEESCLVVFFADGQSHERAQAFINDIKKSNPDCTLVQSKEAFMKTTDAERVFCTDSYSSIVQRGPVIGLEYNGNGCIKACQHTAMDTAKQTGSTGLVFVSNNPKTASQQIDNFYNFADMQMKC